MWSLADQGVASLGSFLTHVLLARALPPSEYGAYVLILGVVLFLNSIHASLVSYPLLVYGAKADAQSLRRMCGACLAATVALQLPLGLAAAGAAWVMGRGWLAPLVIAVVLCWQVQETTRRALMAHLLHRQAIWGDALGYLGQGALIWILIRQDRLSLEAALAMMALTSAAAAALQTHQLAPMRVGWLEARSLGVRFWALGRWILVGNLAAVLNLQAFPWVLARFRGLATAGAFQAALNLLGVTHPVMLSVGNLLVPVAAQSGRPGPISPSVRRYATGGALAVAPYFALLMAWPGAALAALYGPASPYAELRGPLRILVVSYLFQYPAQVLSALLNGLGDSRSDSQAQTAGAAGAILVGLPLAARFGVGGAAAGVSLVNALRAGCAFWRLRKIAT